MSKFNPDDPRITAYVLGELDSKQQLQFETELTESPELQAAVAGVRGTVGKLEAAFRAEVNGTKIEPVHSSPSQQVLAGSRAARSRWAFAAVVAVLLVGIGVSVAIPPWSSKRVARNWKPSASEESDVRNEWTAHNTKASVENGAVKKLEVADVNPRPLVDSAPGEAEADFDSFVGDIINDVAPDSWDDAGGVGAEGEGPIQKFPLNLSVVVDNSEVVDEQTDASSPVAASADSGSVMMVTPEIVIAEEEESRLVDRFEGDDPFGAVVAESAVTEFEVTANGPTDLLTDEYHRGNLVSDALVSDEAGKATDASVTLRTRGGVTARGTVNESLAQIENLNGPHVAGENVRRVRPAPIADGQPNAREHWITLELRHEQLVARFGNRHPDVVELSKQLATIDRRALQLEEKEKQLQLEGRGPGYAGDNFEPIHENDFVEVKDSPLSTFSVDVDTASYSKARQFLMEANSLPRPDSVRIEELLNYFRYDYEQPTMDDPFSANTEVAACPWAPKHRLVRIGLQGKTFPKEERPPTNLVFLLDVSGSMDHPNKLPLLRRSMKLLVKQLGENDRVAITVYAGAAGKVLESTTADKQDEILSALERLACRRFDERWCWHSSGISNGSGQFYQGWREPSDIVHGRRFQCRDNGYR